MGFPAQNFGSSHLLELTYQAFRVAQQAAARAAEGVSIPSSSTLNAVRDREKELDSLDRDIDDLVTSTITNVPEMSARELLACMKFAISLERIGDLLLSFCNRTSNVAVHLEPQDVRDLTAMASRVETMIADAETAFRERNLDKAVAVLRADGELDRLRNVITFRHLETESSERRLGSFHILFMAQELERSGDHVKNIAEEVCHLISGRTVRHVLRTYDRPVEQLFIEHLRKQDL
jgi:phosphate transport system protein